MMSSYGFKICLVPTTAESNRRWRNDNIKVKRDKGSPMVLMEKLYKV
jgi:hypothetical protein